MRSESNADHTASGFGSAGKNVSILNSCITAVRLNDTENFWLVNRCLHTLAEHGRPIDERMNRQWLARLRSHAEPDPAHTGRKSDTQAAWSEIY